MGNFFYKNKPEKQNNKQEEKEKNIKEEKLENTEKIEKKERIEKIKKNQEKIKIIPPCKAKEEKKNLINLKLINKQTHSKQKDVIIDIIYFSYLENTIIIGTRSGEIKEISQITNEHDVQDYSNILLLYSCSKTLYSLILLENNNNNFCVGLSDEILILKFNIQKKGLLDKHTVEKGIELHIPSEGPIHSLLELKNGNFLSAGKNIILWIKHTSLTYKEANKVPIGNSRIINLVEFTFYNTILAIQENKNIIHIFKNNQNSISLVKTSENIPSIWYKGSCQKFSKNCMLLIGKFELNMIDPLNGEILSRYPLCGRGNLLNMSKKGKERGFWIISSFTGDYFEFYEQEGNDLLYYNKLDLSIDNKIGWGNKLVKINDKCFAVINHSGYLFVFEIERGK